MRPYPGPGGKWQVSTEGGEEPVWSHNGRELFYRNGQKWMVVAVATQPTFTAQTPRLLFEGPYLNVPGPSYDVTHDGQHFILIKESEKESAATQLNVVLNWFDELKRRVPQEKH